MQEAQNNSTLTIIGYGLPRSMLNGGVKFVDAGKRNTVSSRYKITWGKEFILPYDLAYPLTMGCTIRGCGENLTAGINMYLMYVLEVFAETRLTYLAKAKFEPLLQQDRCWKRGWKSWLDLRAVDISMGVCPLYEYKQLWPEHEWRKFMVEQFLTPFHSFLILPRELRSGNIQKSTLFDETLQASSLATFLQVDYSNPTQSQPTVGLFAIPS